MSKIEIEIDKLDAELQKVLRRRWYTNAGWFFFGVASATVVFVVIHKSI